MEKLLRAQKKEKSIEGSEEACEVKKPGRWKTSGAIRYTLAASLFVFFNFSNFALVSITVFVCLDGVFSDMM